MMPQTDDSYVQASMRVHIIQAKQEQEVLL